MNLRDNFQIDDLAYEAEETGEPSAPAEHFYSDGGTAMVGEPIPGSGLPADQVELQSTDMRPYMAIPGLAKMEADVTKARYGGSTIQDAAAAEKQGQPAGQPGQPAQGPGRFDRRRFEGFIFNEMGGNPFEIDVVREVDKKTAESLPKLFNQVFKGNAIWEDRGRLSKKQQDFWQNEVKRFRSHLKDRVTSDRKTKVDYYNFMMKNFDNEAKETEARAKRQAAQAEKEGKGTTTSVKDMRKRLDDIQRTKRDILKRQGEIMQKATMSGATEVPEEFEAEFMELADQLKYINNEAHQILMKTDSEYRIKKTPLAQAHSKKPTAADLVAPKPKPSGEPAKPETVKGKLPDQPAQPTSEPSSRIPKVEPKKPAGSAPGPAPKYKPHPKGTPVAVRRDDRTGKLMGQMQDGSVVWLDEVKG